MNYNITNNPCYGDSLGIIKALVPDTSYTYEYLWSTTEITDIINGLSAGFYTVVINADSGLCLLYDTLEITEPPPVISPQGDTAFCLGDSVMLNLGSFNDFLWNDNYNGQFRWISQEDSFIISVEDYNGCWSIPDTISIRQDLPPFVAIGEDTTVCLGASLYFDAGDGYDAYLWSTNSALSSINVQYTGTYWVRVYEKTCIVTDTINVYNCPAKFIVPNVFTPNGDGINDVFNIEYQNIWEFEIRIYSRWGNRIYRSSDLEKPWNGMIKGQEAIEGVYFWEIIYEEYDGKGDGYEPKKIKGTVTLYRNKY
jgi:gliding motility-associated-like protein